MNEEQAEVQVDIKHRVVKWDGEAPPDGTDPVGHPQCIEILEIEDGKVRVIYRRSIQ